ncbi:GNAT family N-acetyltransferase [Phaeovulum vinaykumarii]|uniref:L-ornithine N(alpha)-acyltransferase n=1 Tax=Phaeovulum vinaykumarii TaxID=407234 RepID=A0A1N7MEG5_9RHOB|nr:GNAT family N-acyltransferase [Phaeovulum vinaykumarii]SIS84438.1 ornithine-acyl[acyl carrier protein] N-acyltransferase [Phaeovulum vinaykumarii]SOC11772.1 ornithine-acyl[acyl carrier protein] N-acyltransferase [Phaeovulum vinaykumarii]
MASPSPALVTRLAQDARDLAAAHRLRYEVFVSELGGGGAGVDHQARIERDEFDEVCDHLILVDTRVDPDSESHVVGVYRVLPGERAREFGRFYCDAEYDLGPLRASGRRLVELGRSCVHPDHRGGPAMFLIWNALADYVLSREIEILFGVASFHGTDVEALAEPLSWLHHHHLARPALRARARAFQRMDLMPPEALDRRRVVGKMPGLIRAYLRLGGCVGEGAFVDHEFNTTDVLMMMDTKAMSTRHLDYYARRVGEKG